MSSKNIIIFSILILVLVGISNTTIINFDPNAAAYFEEDIIVKNRRLACDSNEMVNLNGTFLSEIPRGFIKSSTVKAITLSNNKITRIPHDAFDDVPNLECLDLSYNKISILDLLDIRHDHLKILIFDHQEALEWDNFLQNNIPFYTSNPNFPNVEVLSLKRIGYEHSSLYANLFPKLSTIYWEDNQVAYVTPNITDYFSPNLKVIHLERNNLKRFITNDLQNVEELYLDENPLEYLSIDVSSNLKILSLMDCNIEFDWKLYFPTLITLDLSRNKLQEINAEYNATPNLENLSLNYNRFTTFPRLEHFSQLRKLSLNYNSIKTINFVTTSLLKTLHLRGNEITHVDYSAFVNVPNLEELDLAENKLNSLPYNWGSPLKMLRYINLSSNRFKSIAHIDSSSCINLNHIFVKNNYFRTISKDEIKYIPDNCTVYVA
ncbi:keratocan [Megachile rotundata]|uniref:keratocan n=1 Tax=Megachile rotundata TaxID=143995 RepID=UPI000614F109|nr:PREDICTED: leucine-rich repeat transmembrane neuronal protein 2-like [Megachile rotundata]